MKKNGKPFLHAELEFKEQLLLMEFLGRVAGRKNLISLDKILKIKSGNITQDHFYVTF